MDLYFLEPTSYCCDNHLFLSGNEEKHMNHYFGNNRLYENANDILRGALQPQHKL